MIEVDVLEKLAKNDEGGSQYVSIGFYLQWCIFIVLCLNLLHFLLSCTAVCRFEIGLITATIYAL